MHLRENTHSLNIKMQRKITDSAKRIKKKIMKNVCIASVRNNNT